MTTPPIFGFRVVGPVTGERRLVEWQAAFVAHCTLDPRVDPAAECYLSAFTFGDDFRDHMHRHRTPRGFDGDCYAPWVPFDIDRADDLPAALADGRRLVGTILERYPALDERFVPVWFSGGKGAHVMLPAAVARPEPSRTFNRVTKAFAEALAARAGVRIDTGVYDKQRNFRSPGSRHRSGRYKRFLTHREFMHLTPAAVLELAADPAACELPDPAAVPPIPVAADDWLAAERSVAAATAHAGQAGGNDRRCLQRATIELIRGLDTPADGERQTRLFRAAADLTAHGSAPGVVRDLLTDPGRDCGLPPAEVAHAIASGIQRGGRP